jgi:1,4-dihydroxy-2-naphthoyl-CoA hydrolase
MKKLFEFQTRVTLYDSDAAGVLFFASQFRLVHDAYEAFLESKNLGLSKIIREASYLLPLVHASTNYKAILVPGDPVVIKLFLKKMSKTSFTVAHEIYKRDGTLTGHGETVHVSVNKQNREKIPLPAEIKEILDSPLPSSFLS